MTEKNMEKRLIVLIVLLALIAFALQPQGTGKAVASDEAITTQSYLNNQVLLEEERGIPPTDVSNDLSQQSPPTPQQTFQCATSIKKLPIRIQYSQYIPMAGNIQIGSPRSGGASREYFIAYTTGEAGNEFKVYGAGPDNLFVTTDDTGDRRIQRTGYPSLAPMWYGMSAFGDTVAYLLYSQQSSMQAILAKRAGPDGLLGLGGDDQISSIAVQPLPSQFQFTSNLGLSSNGIAYGVFDGLRNIGYTIRQDFVDGIPGGNDIIEVVDPDNPFNMFPNHIQTSANKVTISEYLTLGPVPPMYDRVISLVGPGQNRVFEPQSLPTFDDERLVLGGGDASEMKSQLSYDASFLIDIFQSPSGGRPPQATVFAQLYDLRPIGGPIGRLTGIPTASTIPLSAVPQGITPNIEFVDVDGPYNNAQNLRIAGSLAVVYSYYITRRQLSVITVLYRNAGLDGIFLNNDDQISTSTIPSQLTVQGIDVKENMVALIGMTFPQNKLETWVLKFGC